jgi:uncharacterized protein (TIGR03790 family)
VQPRSGSSVVVCLCDLLVAAGLALVGQATPAYAQSAENVAVIINDNSPGSQRIGEHYARVRALPPTNVVHIRTSVQETIDRATFQRTIEQPIGDAIARARLHDRILYLVLTKGVPLRVAGTVGQTGTVASVDSELTLLYRRMSGQPIRFEGPVANPYFLGEREVSDAGRFTHREHDIFLVSRLDAYTVEEALALIDKGSAPSGDGRIVLDQRAALVNRTGENWLELASKRLAAQGRGNEVVFETTPKPARDVMQVLGYFSWGSTDPQNRVRSYGMSFVPGAIAANFVGSDARTFLAPPESWIPTDPGSRTNWYAGSPESLIGDLIRDGVTGVAGYVAQPFLNGTVRPQILFPAYVAGFNLIEAFYLAMPSLGWQAIVVGDPLCAPFSRTALARSEIEDGLDEATEMPALFSKRRLAVAVGLSPGVPERAVALSLRGDLSALRGDPRAARVAIDEALQIAPRYVIALLQSATLDEQAGLREQAMERYRQILEVEPNQVLALNNLAYGLAVYRKMPMEGLAYAQRAAARAPNNANVLDTLGWIQHLLGDDASAVKVMAQVARANLQDADIRLHAAIVFAAQGVRAVAENELAAALKLRPALEKSDEVRQLRAKLAAPPAPSAPPRK